MFKKIMVPLDGSEIANEALPIAIKLAQHIDAEILLVRAPVLAKIPLPAGIEGMRLFDETMAFRHEQSEHYLGYIRQTYIESNIRITEYVAEGDPASVIVDTAEAKEIDLIIMTTHGRTGLRRWLMGSVTDKVLRHATCPVLVLRDDQPIKEIVITLDGSELSEIAVAGGLLLANAFDAHLTLLRVMEPPEQQMDEAQLEQLDPETLSHFDTYPEIVRQQALDYLKKIAANYPEIAVDCKVMAGQVAEAIVDFADLHQTDLIVMATHGDTGLDRWKFGSVTEKVVRSVPSAIMVIRSYIA